MRSSLISLLGLLGSASSAPTANYHESVLAGLQKRALAALKAAEGNSTSSNGCSLADAAVRKDWSVHIMLSYKWTFQIDNNANRTAGLGLP